VVDRRNETEATWGIGTFVEATIVVYGWFQARHATILWAAG
jgi:hypothetical protein